MTAGHETALRLLDDIIKAAVAAKDLLLAAQGGPPVNVPDAPLHGALTGTGPLPLDVSGDLDAIPANRIGGPS